jgi:hypothetical protein
VACNGSARRRHSTILLLGALAVIIAACGGGGSAPVASTSSCGVGTVAPVGGTPGNPNIATLTWDATTHPDLCGYRIYYGPAPGTYLQSLGQGINAGNVTTYTITGLSSRTRYYFAVTAVGTSNNESGFSNEVFKDIP